MKSTPANPQPIAGSPAASRPGRRMWILAPAFVLLGIALAGLWFKSGKRPPDFLLPGPAGAALSDSTRDFLSQLSSPVEIRFYSILPPESAPETVRDFSGRVDHLLSEFQGANERQIRVTRNNATTGANADAASADGLQPFNLEKGDACFLGIAVASGGRKESLARIQPEWEPALPFDLARAILHVTAAAPSVAGRKQASPVSAEATNAVRRLIADVANTSLEEGTRILRVAAVEELTTAGAGAENQIELARQKLADAQSSGSEAEQQAARNHLQDVQFEQSEKIKAIAARLQEELAVFEQMKAAAPAK
jgi:hypothetical protein